jgi:hypothetical protein
VRVVSWPVSWAPSPPSSEHRRVPPPDGLLRLRCLSLQCQRTSASDDRSARVPELKTANSLFEAARYPLGRSASKVA